LPCRRQMERADGSKASDHAAQQMCERFVAINNATT
jgi:hypothetical protein